MKPIPLEGKITDGSALPIIIRLFQYSTSREKSNPGDIGNEYFAYSVDCRHKKLISESSTDGSNSTIPYSDEEEGFRHFNTIFTEKADPMINRKYITDNFFVITIPDYSFQAMTQKYTDFVVQVYTADGRKIPQRYIGLLKSYTRRECYILISKTINNIWTDTNKINLENEMNIRVIFKENIEKDASYESGDNDDHIYTDKYDYNILKGDKNYTVDNYLYSDTIALSDNLNKDPSNGSFVNRQTGETIINDKEVVSYDYFKQVFQIDYSLQDNKNINRPNEYGSEETHDEDFDLLSKQNNYEFVEFNTETAEITGIYRFSEPEEFNIFSNDGKILIPGKDYSIKYNGNFISDITIDNYNSNLVYELIPEFDSNRKIRFGGTVKAIKAIINDKEEDITKFNIDEFNKSFLKTGKFFNNGNYDHFKKRVYINGFLSNADSYIADDNILVILTDFLDNEITNSKYNDDGEIPEITNFTEKDVDDNKDHIGSKLSNPFTNEHSTSENIYQPLDDLRIFEKDILGRNYFEKNETSVGNEDSGETKEYQSYNINTEEFNYDNLMSTLKDNIEDIKVDSKTILEKYDDATKNLRLNLMKMIGDPITSTDTEIKINRPIDFLYIHKEGISKLEYTISVISETFEVETNELTKGKGDFIILPFWQFNLESDPDTIEDSSTSTKDRYFLKYWMLNNKEIDKNTASYFTGNKSVSIILPAGSYEYYIS